MHQIDRFTIDQIGMKEEILMENAGVSIFRYLEKSLKKEDEIAVLIGAGNNGGDGFVIARYLIDAGFHVDVWLVPERSRIQGCAKYHMDLYFACGYELKQWDDTFYHNLDRYSVIIDSLLGTGIRGKVRKPYDEIITSINEQFKQTVISVDLPSGMTDEVMAHDAICIKATETITIQCPKVSAYLFPNRHYYGKLTVVSIGIPSHVIKQVATPKILWTTERVKETLPRRSGHGHKGTFGKALIIAGSHSMTGAPILTAKACHKAGAGLVTVALPDRIYPIVASCVIEATFLPCPTKEGSVSDESPLLMEQIPSFDAIAIGPGLSRQEHLEKIVERLLLECDQPLIIDADGLYHLTKLLPLLKQRTSPTILTPHHGEMARLAKCSVEDVANNRFELAKQFATEYGVYLLLKGPYSLLSTPEGEQFINPTGNVSLAKGGSGDVLTGIILAQVMQKQSVQEAISNAMYIHGKASDVLVENDSSVYDVLATDVINKLPQVFRDLI